MIILRLLHYRFPEVSSDDECITGRDGVSV